MGFQRTARRPGVQRLETSEARCASNPSVPDRALRPGTGRGPLSHEPFPGRRLSSLRVCGTFQSRVSALHLVPGRRRALAALWCDAKAEKSPEPADKTDCATRKPALRPIKMAIPIFMGIGNFENPATVIKYCPHQLKKVATKIHNQQSIRLIV